MSPNTPHTQQPELSRKSIGMIIGIITGSFLFALGSIPLYNWVCSKIDPGGSSRFNGETEAYQGVRVDKSRTVRVRFSTNVERTLPWSFRSDGYELKVHPGAKNQLNFHATNKANHETRGKAVYDINPPEAAAYFKKVECFCFVDQTLAANQSAELPLVFWFDPDMPRHIKQVNVGYTFFNFDSSRKRRERAEASQ